MKASYLLLVLFLVSSCIPVKVAPRFKNNDYKIMQAKKFKRKLPIETCFIFKDSKSEGEIHEYFNTKYGKNRTYDDEFLIQINNENYYLAYTETDKEDATLNLPFVIIDTKLDQEGFSPLFEGNYSSRKGHWYIFNYHT